MSDKIVIFAGVLTEYQGIDVLLEAVPLVLEKLRNVKFVIIGYPNEQQYRDKARSLGVEPWTHFTGRISYEDVPRYLALADVAVSPKISTTEANLKLFTYMAMGLPTVVFDNPINREILGDVGIYAESTDAKGLSAALVRVLQDDQAALQFGRLGREKAADEHSWSVVARRLGEIYNSVQNQRQRLALLCLAWPML